MWSPWKSSPVSSIMKGEAVHDILHAWGTNGIITRIWLALTPSVEWAQCVVAFDTFDQAFDFSERDRQLTDEWTKRLVTTSSSGLFLRSSARCAMWCSRAKRLFFLMIAEDQQARNWKRAGSRGWRRSTVTFSAALHVGLRTVPLLSDYTWNHTTLWAMKLIPSTPICSAALTPAGARSQFAKPQAALRRRISASPRVHQERSGCRAFPGSIPVVRFTTERPVERNDRLLP